MYVHTIKYNFSFKQLVTQRIKFQQKTCFKPSLNYLKLKTTPSIAIASRLYRDGNFLRLYKKLCKAFICLLYPSIKYLPFNNEFKNLFNQYISFRDFNRICFWKFMGVNPLFGLKRVKKKKILYYLRPEKRIILILSWIKNILRLRKKNSHNCSVYLFNPLFHLIKTNKNINEIYSMKLKIYKIRLSRG